MFGSLINSALILFFSKKKCFFINISQSFAGNSARLAWVRHGNSKTEQRYCSWHKYVRTLLWYAQYVAVPAGFFFLTDAGLGRRVVLEVGQRHARLAVVVFKVGDRPMTSRYSYGMIMIKKFF